MAPPPPGASAPPAAPGVRRPQSFIPLHLLRRLALDPAPISAPRGHAIQGAAIFADISGFTRLVERLAAEGAPGLERLSGIINAYFGRLLDVLAAHGGDVFNFAGDAVLALILADAADDVPETARRAARCGLALQEALRELEPAPGLKLALKVSVGAGQVTCAEIGGVLGRWDFVVAGPMLHEIGASNARARPGDVIVSPGAWPAVRERFAGEPIDGGHVRLTDLVGRDAAPPVPLPPAPEPGAVPDAAIYPFLPGTVRTRLALGHRGWLAEMRRVTVLFVNLRGLDFRAPLLAAHETMRAVQEALYRLEGSVQRLAVDDKGATLVAALGLPPLAHEDDALRGAKAALAIQEVLTARGQPHSVGVTTGRAFCGSVGTERRCEYTMVGDVMNLASRLMMAAGSGILCDAPTREAAAHQVDFEELPPLALKGKAQPVPVFRPRGLVQAAAAREPEAGPAAAFVGRATERLALRARLQEFLAGEPGGVALIEGEAGIGKSTLLRELRREAQESGGRALVGRADSIERATAYRAWRGVFSGLLGLDGVADPAGRRAAVLRRRETDPARLRAAPLLDAVLGLDLPESDFTRPMTGEVRAANTHALLMGLLSESARAQRLVVFLEDAHWLDSASWALVRLVAREVEHVLLVVTTRPLRGQAPPDLARTLEAPRALKLRLESLAAEEALALLKLRLGVEHVDPAVVELVCGRAQGVPFFIEELAFALRERGAISVVQDRCLMTPGTDPKSLDLPDNVQAVVTQRIDRLPPGAQLSIKVASVVGRTFTRDILRDVHPIEGDRDHIDEHVRLMARAELLREGALEGEAAHAFKHVITQEVAYGLMLIAQRQPLHRAVAEWHERRAAADLEPIYPLLAHHYAEAGDDAKAVRYLDRAGEAAMREFASEEAISFFARAGAIAGRVPGLAGLPDRARWENQLGEACYALSDFGKCREHLRRALDLAGVPSPRSLGRFVFSLFAQMAKQALHLLFPARFLDRGGEAERPLLLQAARANERICQVYYMDEAKVESMETAIRALNLSERAGPSAELARSYANVALTASLIPIYPLSERYARRALEAGEAIGDPRSLAYILEVTAIYFHQTAGFARCRKAVGRAIEIAEGLGDRRRLDETVFLLALTEACQGALEKAAQAFEDLYASARRRGTLQPQAWGGWGRIEALLARGRPEGAVADVEAVLRESDRRPGALPKADQIGAHAALALAYLRAGERDRAFSALERAAELLRRSRTVSMYLRNGFAAMAEVAIDAWEAGERGGAAREIAKLAVGALRGFSRVYAIGRPQTWLWRGAYAWAAGRRGRARRWLARGLAEAERLGMPHAGAIARLEIGRRLPAGPERRGHLDAARRGFRELGAPRDAERVPAE